MIKHNLKYGHPSVKGSPPLVYTNVYKFLLQYDSTANIKYKVQLVQYSINLTVSIILNYKVIVNCA